jgi:hypothetical protein
LADGPLGVQTRGTPSDTICDRVSRRGSTPPSDMCFATKLESRPSRKFKWWKKSRGRGSTTYRRPSTRHSDGRWRQPLCPQLPPTPLDPRETSCTNSFEQRRALGPSASCHQSKQPFHVHIGDSAMNPPEPEGVHQIDVSQEGTCSPKPGAQADSEGMGSGWGAGQAVQHAARFR